MQRFTITNHILPQAMEEIRQLYQDTGGRSATLTADQLAEIRQTATILVAVVDKQHDAFIAFAWVKLVEAGKAVIMDPVVHPDFRRFGIGHMLLRHILTHPDLELSQSIVLASHADESQLLTSWRLPWMQSAQPPKKQADGTIALDALLLPQFI